MCNKHFILSAKCISKKARSKYIKPHDQFCRVPCPMEYEPDLDLVYQGGNLTGAETCPYPVHIWQGRIIERPVGAARSPGRRFELLSRSGLAGTPLLLAANRFYRCQPGWRPVTQAASYQALPTGGTSLVGRVEADTTKTAASEDPAGVRNRDQRGQARGRKARKVWFRKPPRRWEGRSSLLSC